jgi:hypothetical protein
VGPALAGKEANTCAKKYTRKMVRDYKLVDSVKKKAFKTKWMKEGKFTAKTSQWKGSPNTWSGPWDRWNTTAPAPGGYGNTTNTTVTSNSSTRRIFSKKFRGLRGGSSLPNRKITRTAACGKAFGFLQTHKIEIAVTISGVGVATYVVIRYRNHRKNQRALEAANPKRTEAFDTP